MALGFMGFLPEMISKTEENSPVVLTCRAIGQAFITRRIRTAEAQSKRAMAYGQALASTNAALRDPHWQTRDETLTCVWLLSLYEVSKSSHVNPAKICVLRPEVST